MMKNKNTSIEESSIDFLKRSFKEDSFFRGVVVSSGLAILTCIGGMRGISYLKSGKNDIKKDDIKKTLVHPIQDANKSVDTIKIQKYKETLSPELQEEYEQLPIHEQEEFSDSQK